MNNEFKAVIGIMRASNLLVDDLKKNFKELSINATEFSVMEFLYSKGEKSHSGNTWLEYYLLVEVQTYVVDNLEKKRIC